MFGKSYYGNAYWGGYYWGHYGATASTVTASPPLLGTVFVRAMLSPTDSATIMLNPSLPGIVMTEPSLTATIDLNGADL